jgi:hypothetical protein
VRMFIDMPRLPIVARLSLLAGGAIASFVPAAHAYYFNPADLVISESTFVPNTGEAASLSVGSPIIVAGTPETGTTGNAVAQDTNLSVFTNVSPDANFGITSPLSLLQINTSTFVQDGPVLQLPTAQIVTSFSSKSEGSIYLSQNGQSLTIAGYNVADGRNPVGALDVSNASTTAAGSNPSGSGNANGTANRTVAQIDVSGNVATTNFNAFSGNNPRGAILYNNTFYIVGNANAGNTGVEALTPGNSAPWVNGQTQPNNAIQIGQYSITQQGDPADKATKDNNFRGETIFDNTLYVTKGSGSNGIDTVYQVGAAGALANGQNLAASATISILPGFPTALAKPGADYTPFGLWFANSSTLYVADEGTGDVNDTGVGSHAGLEKWSLVKGAWVLDYTLQNGLIGTTQSYTAAGFTGTVMTDGLRDITGVVNADGTVTIYGVTSTMDNITNMDDGADPNALVAITDNLAMMALPASEDFSDVIAPSLGTVIRGVSEAPVPEPASIALLLSSVAGLSWLRRRRAATTI